MTPEKQFWDWLAANEAALCEMPAEPRKNRIDRRLGLVGPGLGCEVAPAEGDRWDLILTAHGVIENFPLVESLAAAAPDLNRFRVVAFAPARPQEVPAEDIRFQRTTDGDVTGVTLFVNGYTEERQDRVTEEMSSLLSALLGEYDLETKVGFVDVKAMPERAESLPKLKELPVALGSFPHRP